MSSIGRIRLSCLGLVIFFAINAMAVPIKPDLEKILRQQQQPSRPYVPARAGWDGPEMARSQDASPNPIYEAYGPASTARLVRASLRAAATPDPAALAGLGMLIVLWRIWRNQREQRARMTLGTPHPSTGPPESRAA